MLKYVRTKSFIANKVAEGDVPSPFFKDEPIIVSETSPLEAKMSRSESAVGIGKLPVFHVRQ